MDIIQAIFLALIQGITEFLPISSSAHLILPSQLLGWPDQGLAFDVAVHVGSLAAVCLYFRKDVGGIALGGINSLLGKWSDDGRLAWLLVLATIPGGLLGILFSDYIETNFRSAEVIACASLVGAGLLLIADRKRKGDLEILDLSWKIVLLIGIAQATALIPGTSRSGITITAALLLGLSPSSSAKFSFLMSIPLIAGAGLLSALNLLETGDVQWSIMLIGAVISGISAYLCIHYFLKMIQSIGLMPFVIYRVIFGISLLAFF